MKLRHVAKLGKWCAGRKPGMKQRMPVWFQITMNSVTIHAWGNPSPKMGKT
jgi:hypothetical protein